MDTLLAVLAFLAFVLLAVGVLIGLLPLHRRVTSLERNLHRLQEDLDYLKPCTEPDVVRGPPGGMW